MHRTPGHGPGELTRQPGLALLCCHSSSQLSADKWHLLLAQGGRLLKLLLAGVLHLRCSTYLRVVSSS